MHQAKKKLKDIQLGDVFHGIGPENGKVYINENLTGYRRYLFGKLLVSRKQNKINNTWTIDGKIFVKLNEHDNPLLIRNEQELENLLNR